MPELHHAAAETVSGLVLDYPEPTEPPLDLPSGVLATELERLTAVSERVQIPLTPGRSEVRTALCGMAEKVWAERDALAP